MDLNEIYSCGKCSILLDLSTIEKDSEVDYDGYYYIICPLCKSRELIH